MPDSAKESQKKKKMKLLIVEDEEAILQGLKDVFVFHGFEVEEAKDGKTGMEKALSGKYDLILLDVMLPQVDGFTICNAVRKNDRRQPIIMLTAKTSEDDIITGLTMGADDYVGKPFSVRQLVLRVEAVLRRADKKVTEEAFIDIGQRLRIDTRNLQGFPLINGQVSKQSEPIDFTRREIDIIQYLLAHHDRPVNRDELLVEVWGYNTAENIETRTVDIHMAKLRRKVEKDVKNPTFLITVRGEGYRIIKET